MIDLVIKAKCTGCEACASSCPKKCIKMVPDREGFLQPIVDSESCVRCEKCLKICPVLNFYKNHATVSDRKQAVAFRAHSDEYRSVCSSGGVFLALANAFVEAGGIVFGAAFDEEFKLKHQEATDKETLYRLAGSKYLQSRIGDIYQKVKDNLTDGKKVLFVGMTCQVEGLMAYLGKDYPNLYCVDLICMGIPSPMVWEKYLNAYHHKERLRRVNFKDKKLGWHRFSVYIENQNGESISVPGFDHPYMQCMFKGYSIRPSCFQCTYKCESKIADITIADCWGCENYISELDDNRGLSMVIAHSEKSEYLLSILEKTGIVKAFEYENVLKYNSNYQCSTTQKDGRRLFYKLLKYSPKLAFIIMGQNPNKTLLQRIKVRVLKGGQR